MNLNSRNNWLRRSIISAILSAAALSMPQLQRLEPFYWAPGFFFALLVVSARSRQPALLGAVLLSYTVGYSSSNMLESLGFWPMRIGVVAIGSGLLALSLRWKGGLSDEHAGKLAMLGTALAIPFWWFLLRQPGGGAPSFPLWIAGLTVWQMPMAWYYLKESSS